MNTAKKLTSMLLCIVFLLATVVSAIPYSLVDVSAATYKTGYNSFSSSYASSPFYTKFQNVPITGDGRTDVIAVALSQIGYQESDCLKRFLDAKQQILAKSVSTLCREFKSWGLQVGLDVFAPLLSSFVGQSLPLLAKEADFLKPMLYRRTLAPAGIGYEYELLKRCAPTAAGYPNLVNDAAFLKRELESLRGLPCAVYPGIEVNRLDDIAPTDAAYVAESLALFAESGVEGATLSWDVMLAPESHLPFSFT